jgi:hypothetical protein
MNQKQSFLAMMFQESGLLSVIFEMTLLEVELLSQFRWRLKWQIQLAQITGAIRSFIPMLPNVVRGGRTVTYLYTLTPKNPPLQLRIVKYSTTSA